MFPSVSVSTPNSLMVLDTNLRENYASQPIHLQENYLLKPRMKDEQLPFVAPNSSQCFLQDFNHIDQFHPVHGSSSSNQVFGVQTQNFDPFDNAACAQTDFEVYDGNNKSFAENNGSGHAHLIDNFQYDGYSLNIPRRNIQVDMMVENHSYFPFNNPSETKPLNYVVPDDEVSSIAPTNYYQRAGLNRNNRLSPTTRRAFKARKKSNIVKGQWTVDEDRCIILSIIYTI